MDVEAGPARFERMRCAAARQATWWGKGWMSLFVV